MEQTQFSKGLKKNGMIILRVSSEEKERLTQLAKVEGCSTLAMYCRRKLFESLSTELKLNKILDLLNKK
jgi:hypothetical protein